MAPPVRGPRGAPQPDEGGVPAGGVAGAERCASSSGSAATSQAEFPAVVTDLVGAPDTRRYGALLLAGAHGIADMELTGHLGAEGLNATADELVDALVRMVTDTGART
ncbi:hypothetical protein ACGFXC_27030 [Streptomyces sp. NPDC048507]|uniref:hypothetical protein n=1 Tax=Streptomyces sp. NPDC048507 TaxID=3365560 RepID=UPI003714EA42